MTNLTLKNLACEYTFRPLGISNAEFRTVLLNAALAIARSEPHPHIICVIDYMASIEQKTADRDPKNIQHVRLMYWIDNLRVANKESNNEFQPEFVFSQIPWLEFKRRLIERASESNADKPLRDRAIIVLTTWHQLVADNSELLIKR